MNNTVKNDFLDFGTGKLMEFFHPKECESQRCEQIQAIADPVCYNDDCPLCQDSEERSTSFLLITASERGRDVKDFIILVVRLKEAEMSKILLFWLCNTKSSSNIELRYLSSDNLKHFYLPNPSNQFNFSPCNLCTVS